MTNVTENTPVTVTLPLGLARTVVTALAEYARLTNEDRLNGSNPPHDARVLQLIAGANDLVREAATNVEPDFDAGASYAWKLVGGAANTFLRQLDQAGRLKPEAIADTLALMETEKQANAA